MDEYSGRVHRLVGKLALWTPMRRDPRQVVLLLLALQCVAMCATAALSIVLVGVFERSNDTADTFIIGRRYSFKYMYQQLFSLPRMCPRNVREPNSLILASWPQDVDELTEASCDFSLGWSGVLGGFAGVLAGEAAFLLRVRDQTQYACEDVVLDVLDSLATCRGRE